MPPLQLFNRSWHISSDDLVLPAWVGVAFHGTWTSLIAAEVAIIGLPDDCEGRRLATSSVLWLLLSFALTTFLQCVVAGISMRGALLQEYKRAAMPTALYCLLSAYLLEAAALAYATLVNFGLLADSLNTCHTAEELARTSISELSLHRWFIGSTWAMLFVIGGLLVLMYNLYPDRGLESWEKRVNCLSYLLCCRKALTADADSDSAPASAPTVVRLARVFGDLFYPLNFSFTDTVAAITLVGITHRSSAHGHGSSSHNHALIAAAGAGVLGSAKHEAGPGAGALLEAAVAAAAAREARAAQGTAQQNSTTHPDDEGLELMTDCSVARSSQTPRDRITPRERGIEGDGSSPVLGSLQEQEVQATSRASSPAHASAADSCSGVTQRSPSPSLKGIKHSSSTGNVQAAAVRSSSPVMDDTAGMAFGRTASSSAWEAAVRQGSTLAVAPGRGVVPAAGKASGPLLDAALVVRSNSTAVDSRAGATPERGPSPSRFKHRAVSLGSSTLGSQPMQDSSEEQSLSRLQTLQALGQPGNKAPQPVLHSLAESNEFSLVHSGAIEQVQSLLSPLQSAEVPTVGAGGSGPLAAPPVGAAAAGDVVGAAVAGADAIGTVSSEAPMFVNPLYLVPMSSSASTHQHSQSAGGVQQQRVQAPPTGLPSPPAAHPAAAANAATATQQQGNASTSVVSMQPQAAARAAAAAVAAAAVGDAGDEGVGAVTSAGQPVPLELLEEALHWHAYANAIYGWPMFLWSHRYRVLRCCRLCCGGCCKHTPHPSRSSGGGLAVHAPAASASADDSTLGSSKTASFKSSSAGSRSAVTFQGAPPVTAVVTMSSVDTDSTSPASTAAGASEPAAYVGRQPLLGVPLAEGVESTPAGTSSPLHQQSQEQEHKQQHASPVNSIGWDVEQGGAAGAAAPSTQQHPGQHISPSVAALPAASSRSQRWVQSRGNIWLLQALADTLGISRDAAAAADTGAGAGTAAGRVSAGSGAGPGVAGAGLAGGSKAGLASVAGGLWSDESVCGCMCGGKWGASHVPKMAPLTASQRLTNEAIMQTANIPAADLLYVNYNNLVEGLLPYSVVLDAARRCVVVAIRGSLSVEDCVTGVGGQWVGDKAAWTISVSLGDCVIDILYDPAPLDGDWLMQPAGAAALSPQQQACTAGDWHLQDPGVLVPAADAAAAPAQTAAAAEDTLMQQQQSDWPPAASLEEALQAFATSVGGDAAAVPGRLSRSMPGASSGGGSFRSVKASPFASAAAAASVAARSSSTGVDASGQAPPAPRPPPPQQQQQQQQSLAKPPQPPPAQQPQPQASLAPMPSVPAAQAAAAAAAAAAQPLAAAGRPMRRQWSVNLGGLHSHHQPPQQQQLPPLGPRLSEQPSFVRRAASAFKPSRQQSQQQQLLQDALDQQQQQPLTSRPSVLEAALSVLLGPWRRLTASDTGEGGAVRHRNRDSSTDAVAATAAEEGRFSVHSSHMSRHGRRPAAPGTSRLGSFHGRSARGSSNDNNLDAGSDGASSPRRLFKTLSLNLGAALGSGKGPAGQHGHGPSPRRRAAATTSGRMLGHAREQGGLLQSYASEQIPSNGPAFRRSTAESWRQSQTRRTTAADRALGAARAGHRYAPVTSPATDQSAAAAAASQRSFLQHLHNQQQQQMLSSMPSMRSTAPASSTEGSMVTAATGTGWGLGPASEPGVPSMYAGAGEEMQQSSSPGRSGSLGAAAAAGAAGMGPFGDAGSQPGSPKGSRSRRGTFTQLPRINSGAGAVSELQPAEQQQQLQLSVMASVPAPLASQQHQQAQQLRQRPVSDEGSSLGGSTAGGAGSRRSLRAAVSDVAWRARKLGLPGLLSPRQAGPQQQQLSDGGPTDWSLLSGAATMVPSSTAAVPQPAARPAASAGQGLKKSYSVNLSNRAVGVRSSGLSMTYSARPPAPGTPNSAGTSVCSSVSAGAAGSAGEGASPLAQPAPTAAAGEVSPGPVGAVGAAESPFMQQQQQGGLGSDLGASPFAAAAAAAHPDILADPTVDPSRPLWQMQPLLDPFDHSGPEAAKAAAAVAEAEAAVAAEQAVLADEEEEAAAAEADAAAAAAQAAAAEETPDTGAAGAQWFAHEGILNCARAIRDDLDRLGLLDQLLLGSHLTTDATISKQQPNGHIPGSRADTADSDIAACCVSAAAAALADGSEAGLGGVGGAAGAEAAKGGAASAEEGRFMSSSELPDCRGWTLVLTGHSLGAGVAALLALHYRARYAAVRAWCFAPPGGLMSPAAAASLKDICYSLVSAKDMVPRMSLWTIERLRDEMMICALRCKLPKYKLLLGAALGKKWEEAEVLRPLEELSVAEIRAFEDYRRAVVEERTLDPLRVRIAREFVPPGEVLWLERNKQLQPRLRVPNTRSSLTSPSAPASMQQPALGAPVAVTPTQDHTLHSTLGVNSSSATGAVNRSLGSQDVTTAAAVAKSGPASSNAVGFLSSKALGSSSMLRGGSAALEAAAVAVAGKRLVTRLQPHITDGLGVIVGGMVVSRNMFADHVPDKQMQQLKRLVRHLKRQQALGRPLPPGIAPVVVVQPPLQQAVMSRRL